MSYKSTIGAAKCNTIGPAIDSTNFSNEPTFSGTNIANFTTIFISITISKHSTEFSPDYVSNEYPIYPTKWNSVIPAISSAFPRSYRNAFFCFSYCSTLCSAITTAFFTAILTAINSSHRKSNHYSICAAFFRTKREAQFSTIKSSIELSIRKPISTTYFIAIFTADSASE